MKSDKIKQFMALAGQRISLEFGTGSIETRKLGAQLLLSEVLEYVICGLGIEPEFRGVKITEPNQLSYHESKNQPSRLDMLDGLADVAYTMYWNAEAFGVPLERGFELVCDNNLEKFVELKNWKGGTGPLDPEEWHCGKSIEWPKEVVSVQVVEYLDRVFAVGKDLHGKVRKPSSYRTVNLEGLLS